MFFLFVRFVVFSFFFFFELRFLLLWLLGFVVERGGEVEVVTACASLCTVCDVCFCHCA